jgi:hypothetical protein
LVDHEVEQTTARRIERASETLAALSALRAEPSSENVIAFHELHARHLRAQGESERADRADERARRLREGRRTSPALGHLTSEQAPQ